MNEKGAFIFQGNSDGQTSSGGTILKVGGPALKKADEWG